MINHRFKFENSFQEIFHLIYNCINEGSGWIVESIESQYIKISAYRSLSRSSYVKLPVQLRRLRKGLINIKNKDQKCFLWSQVRHINPVKVHQEKTTREDLNFLREKKILIRLSWKAIFALTCLVTKID